MPNSIGMPGRTEGTTGRMASILLVMRRPSVPSPTGRLRTQKRLSDQVRTVCGLPQARRAAALAVRAGTCLRDEEAAGFESLAASARFLPGVLRSSHFFARIFTLQVEQPEARGLHVVVHHHRDPLQQLITQLRVGLARAAQAGAVQRDRADRRHRPGGREVAVGRDEP